MSSHSHNRGRSVKGWAAVRAAGPCCAVLCCDPAKLTQLGGVRGGKGKGGTLPPWQVTAACWFPDGQRFLTAGHDYALYVHSVDGSVERTIRQEQRLYDAVVSRDGSTIVTVGQDKKLHLLRWGCSLQRGGKCNWGGQGAQGTNPCFPAGCVHASRRWAGRCALLPPPHLPLVPTQPLPHRQAV